MSQRVSSGFAVCIGVSALAWACLGCGGSGAAHAGGTGGGASASSSGATGGKGSGGASVAAGTGTGGAGTSSSGTGGKGAGTGGAGTGGGAAAPFKGVALSESGVTCPDIATLKLSWYYNWSATTACNASVEFVPQIWGPSSTVPISTTIANAVAAGAKTVLGFNEPDNAQQSNLTVAQAVALWPELTGAGLRVGSPATSSSAAGQTWSEQFMMQAVQQNLEVDFVALHWYGWGTGSCNDASGLDSYLTWAEQWGKPLWITELGCLNMSEPTPEIVKTFYDDALVVFQKHPLLERYAWFLSRDTTYPNMTLIDTSAMLTPLGIDYQAAASYH